jgi:hypothetical protein
MRLSNMVAPDMLTPSKVIIVNGRRETTLSPYAVVRLTIGSLKGETSLLFTVAAPEIQKRHATQGCKAQRIR